MVTPVVRLRRFRHFSRRSIMRCAILSAVLCLAPLTASAGNKITGDYLEARSCDVWTGPCFANAELGLIGQFGTMAWSIKEGAREGVDLSGLRVIAVVRAADTLTDVREKAVKAKSVIIVDERADTLQRNALVAFAKEMAPELLGDVVRVEAAPIEISLDCCAKSGCAKVTAGKLVRLETRCYHEDDHKCGNEWIYYPPLSTVKSPKSVMAVTQQFQGKGLDATWSMPDVRSAIIATFEK